MADRVTVVVQRAVPVRPEHALAAVWDIKNIEHTEVKADIVTVTKQSPTVGSYVVRGRFAGLPWHGEFFYELNPTGFHSHNAPQPQKGSTIQGGFVIEPVTGDQCIVMHYEEYRLPWYFRPLTIAIKAYLRWSMRRELDALERILQTGAAP